MGDPFLQMRPSATLSSTFTNLEQCSALRAMQLCWMPVSMTALAHCPDPGVRSKIDVAWMSFISCFQIAALLRSFQNKGSLGEASKHFCDAVAGGDRSKQDSN